MLALALAYGKLKNRQTLHGWAGCFRLMHTIKCIFTSGTSRANPGAINHEPSIFSTL